MQTIRDLRQARAWTQFALALKVGVQPHSVYLWESGRRIPQVLQLRKLGALFGLCSDDIVLVGAPAPPDPAGAGRRRQGRHRPAGARLPAAAGDWGGDPDPAAGAAAPPLRP